MRVESRVESAVTSLSWLPSEAVTGLMRGTFTLQVSAYDDPPPDVIDDAAVQADAFHVRFANRLRAWAEFAPDGSQDSDVTADSTRDSTRMTTS